MEIYDLIIIGGSAAATSAGIYAARRNLNFKIITKEFGGEVATSGEIGNWPGISQTDGIALVEQFRNHLEFYNIQPEEGVEVEKIVKQPDGTFAISGKDFNEEAMSALGRSVIIATGVHPLNLSVPGEKEFRNKGVSYCTVCDGPIFAGKKVAVIGGGNSALESALMLSEIAEKVFVVNLTSDFTGEPILVDKLKQKKNVEITHDSATTEIVGSEFVTGLKYNKKGKEQEFTVDGVFVHIGMIPNSGLVPEGTTKDKFGQIIVDQNCQTNIPGLFAAGDVTDIPFKQIIIAAGQGCVATLSAVQYLNKLK